MFIPTNILAKLVRARGLSSKTQCVVAAGSDHQVDRRRFFLRVGAAAVVPPRPLRLSVRVGSVAGFPPRTHFPVEQVT